MKLNRKNPLLAAAFIALATQVAQAVPYYWDNNGATTGFGTPASGTWQTATLARWNTVSTGLGAPGASITTGLGDAVNFGTNVAGGGLGGGTITVSGTVDAASLTFGSQTTGNITLTGGIINLAAATTISVGAGGTTVHTIASQITGAGTSLTKSGNTLALSGANSYAGATNITTGSLIYRNTGAKSALSTHTFSAGTTLGLGVGGAGFFGSTDIDNAFTGTMTGNLSNVVVNANTNVGIDTTAGNFTYATSVGAVGRGLTKFGANTLTLTGANAYTGVTNILAGTLRLENTSAVAGSSTVSVSSGATLQVAANTASTFSTLGLSLIGGTISSDSAGAGVTHTLGGAAISNATQNFTAGANVTSGSAGIQLGNITNASGSGGGATLNPTTANLIVAGGYTGITNAGVNGLTFGGTAAANSMTGDITLGSRANINIAKTGNSVWTLSGNNSASLGVGSTTIVSGGALITTNLAALPNSGLVTFNGGTIGAVMGTSPTNWSIVEVDALLASATKTSGALGIDTTNANLAQWTPFTTTNLGAALGLTKLGTNTLTLDQATNNYAGATTISEGTLKLDVDHTLAGPLNFGFANGTTSPTGTLDLATTNVNATFGGLNVLTNSTAANTITIGTGKTLTITGSTVANVVSFGGAGAGAITTGMQSKLQVTGAGTLTVNDATRNIVVANLGNPAGTASTAEMDLSGLGTFNATIANLYVGRPTLVSGAASNGNGKPQTDVLTLAADNTINASGVIAVGGANASNGQTPATAARLLLGTDNVLNAASFVLGSSRTSGKMEFNTGLTDPTVTIRGAAGGISRTNIYLGDHANLQGVSFTNGGSTTSAGIMDFTGGTVNANIDNLLVGMGGIGFSATRASGNGTFIMDGASSNVDVNTVAIGQTLATAGDQALSGTSSVGTFTVKNGTLLVNTAMTIANDLDATATASGTVNVQGTFTVEGGTATIGATGGSPEHLLLGNHVNAGNPGLATAAVSLTGGTLNVFGDIKQGNLGAGTITSSLSLNGATLDMKGNSIGASGAEVDTLTFASGTLRDVASINVTGGLTKTTAGTLIVEGTNGYLGATDVNDGKLVVNGSISTSNITVSGTGSTLSGSGSSGGSVTIGNLGTLASGNGIESLATGALSFTTGSTFEYEVDKSVAPGVAGDLTAVTGDLSLAGTVTLSLVELGVSGAWELGNPLGDALTGSPNADKLTLISYTGSWNNGLFTYLGNAVLDDSAIVFNGQQWWFNYNDTDAGDNFTGDLTGASFVTITVPEPRAALLGGLGMLALLRRRRN